MNLYKNKYTIPDLEQNIEHLGLWDILLTQELTADFCFTYFWSDNDEYAKDKEDTKICIQDVLNWQAHLTKEILFSCAVYKKRTATYDNNSSNSLISISGKST
jgi:hypothetical protein